MNKRKTVDIVIPTYNEADVITKNVTTLLTFCNKNLTNYQFKIIVSDNGSTDKTYDLIKESFKNTGQVEATQISEKGRGRALLKTWGSSNADICCYMDADLSTDLNHLPIIIDMIDNHSYDLAVGSRHMHGSKIKRGIKRRIVGMTHVIIMKALLGVSFSDPYCGFKAASRDSIDLIFQGINPDRWKAKGNAWFWDTELLVIAEKLGLKIYEEAVFWKDDPTSTAKIIQDSIESIKGIVRLNREKPWRKINTYR